MMASFICMPPTLGTDCCVKLDSLLRENCRDYRDGERETQIMSKDMMIIAPPIQSVAGISGQQVSDNPQTVNVRHDTRPRHDCAFPFVQRRRRIGDSPSHEKVRDRAHQYRDADYSG